MTTFRRAKTRSRARIASEKKLKARETDFAAATSKRAAAEAKATNAEAELTKAQNEKAELESKLQASEGQIADLQKRVAEATVGGGAPDAPEEVSPNEMKAHARRRPGSNSRRPSRRNPFWRTRSKRPRTALRRSRRRKSDARRASCAGSHGTVLAVNQAYNFVVLSMGDRQGVVPNSEMLVMRHGALIGKIRISSVEPTTSIGDIITNSLARGVQVQPGDTVIYAGSTNS